MEPLKVPARLDELGTIGAYVLAAADAGGIDKGAAYRLRLAVDEIATNIIMHGRPGEQGDEIIVITAAVDDESVRIVLEDAGPEFNPLEKQDPLDLSLPAEERQVGGLGVFLALRGVDKFEYDRVGNINRNTLVVRRRSLKTAGTL
jgi:serine/threonine-protein kinase RsbW